MKSSVDCFKHYGRIYGDDNDIYGKDQVKQKQTHRGRRKKQRRNAGYAAQPFLIAGVLFISIVGSLATYAFFPWLGIPGTLLMIGSGFVVDYLVYYKGMTVGFKTIFGTGLFTDLKDYMAIKAVKKWLLNSEKNNLADLKANYKDFYEGAIKKAKAKSIAEKDWDDYFVSQLAKKVARRHLCYTKMPIYNDNHDPLKELVTGYNLYFDHDKRKRFMRNFHLKSALTAGSALFALITGIGWFAIIATEAFEFFGIVSLASTGAIPIIGIAILVGFMQGLIFYNTLQKAIKENFFSDLKDVIKFKRIIGNDGHKYSYLASSPKNFLKWALIGALIILSLIGLTLTQGAYLESSFQLITMAFGKIDIVVNIAIQAIMYLVILPVVFIFTLDHIVSAGKKLTDAISSGMYNISHSSPKDWCKNPGKTLLYGIGYIAVFGALLLHVTLEAVITSVKGSVSTDFLPGKVFTKIIQFFGIPTKAAPVAAGADAGIVEIFVDGDMITDTTKYCINKIAPPKPEPGARKNTSDFSEFDPDELFRDDYEPEIRIRI